MQIYIGFTCRECELPQTVLTDTSDYGILFQAAEPTPVGQPLPLNSPREEPQVFPAKLLELACRQCGHVSGELGLGYRFRAEHRPSHEQEPEECPGV